MGNWILELLCEIGDRHGDNAAIWFGVIVLLLIGLAAGVFVLALASLVFYLSTGA